MKSFFAREWIYLPLQQTLGGNLIQSIKFHESLERQSEDVLRRYQERAVELLLKHAFKNVPFYRNLCQSELNINEKNALGVLSQMPAISKSDIRQNPSLFRDQNYRPSWRSTSGSTGTPFLICKDRQALFHMDAAMHVAYSWHGIEVGDPQARIWGRAANIRQRSTQYIKDMLLNRRRLSAFTITPENSRLFLESLRRFKPAFLYCYPNAAVFFVGQLQKMRLTAKGISLKAVICTAEPLLEQHRIILEQFFHCPAVSEYGTSENGILAMECEHHNMHILLNNVLLEFLKNNEPVQDSEFGEVVVTELHSRSFPFIRYRTGDIAMPALSKKCPCGRTYPLIILACGRDDSFIQVPGGHKIHAAILAYVLKEEILQFRAVQENSGALVIQIVPAEHYNEHLEARFRSELTAYLGNQINTAFVKVARIPPEPNGKVLYFVSRFRKDANE